MATTRGDIPNSMEVGTRRTVQFVFPTHGFPNHGAAELLEVGDIYHVRDIDCGQSLTNIELEELPGEWFNSVLFQDYPPAPTAD